MILALIICGVFVAMALVVVAWCVFGLVEMSALRRRYYPWQDWTITFQNRKER